MLQCEYDWKSYFTGIIKILENDFLRNYDDVQGRDRAVKSALSLSYEFLFVTDVHAASEQLSSFLDHNSGELFIMDSHLVSGLVSVAARHNYALARSLWDNAITVRENELMSLFRSFDLMSNAKIDAGVRERILETVEKISGFRISGG